MNHSTVLCFVFLFCSGSLNAISAEERESAIAVDQIIPANELAKIRSSLPRVAFEGLRNVLSSPQTLWYNDEVMAPSYQDSVGAASNTTWPNLVAGSEKVISGVYDRSRKRWQFPFATTAGTDNSTNIKIENFVYLPQKNGQIQTILIEKVIRNASRYQWDWIYPEGTIFGEVLFIKDGNDLLPAEIRTRKRYTQGWAMNVYRPFPTAQMLADRIKALRPDYQMNFVLSKMVNHLQSNNTLQPKTLAAKEAFAPTFNQSGWIDPLPDFGDKHLVRELLKTTEFAAAYDTAWKTNGNQVTYAATTNDDLSVVPNHYDAGLLEVTDAACMRCHKESGRLVSEFYFDLFLYGELWGKDGIFSFHPYYETRYPELRHTGSGPGGMKDNRQINPALANMGIFRMKSFRLAEATTEIEEVEEESTDWDANRLTYRDNIKPILDQNCTECHSGSPRRTDFSSFPFKSKDQLDQQTIVHMILARAEGPSPSMPPGVRPKLTADHIRQIKAWRDGGLQP